MVMRHPVTARAGGGESPAMPRNRLNSHDSDTLVLPAASSSARRRRPLATRPLYGLLAVVNLVALALHGYLYASSSAGRGAGAGAGAGAGGVRGAQRRSAPLAAADQLRRLVIVAGHAVTMAEDLSAADFADGAWYLLDYQRGRDMPREFVKHARRGAELASADNRALLVFSGGQTRRDGGPRSEAQSYWFVAEHFGWWRHAAVAGRATTEEYARDSYENVLFSLCRFREVTGRYPEAVTVVSFDFKERRFVDLHAAALQFPSERFRFDAVPVDARNARFDRAAAEAGEAATVRAFEADPYGCADALLQGKRVARDPFHRGIPYAASCPEAAPLLAHCGPAAFDGPVPWASR